MSRPRIIDALLNIKQVRDGIEGALDAEVDRRVLQGTADLKAQFDATVEDAKGKADRIVELEAQVADLTAKNGELTAKIAELQAPADDADKTLREDAVAETLRRDADIETN